MSSFPRQDYYLSSKLLFPCQDYHKELREFKIDVNVDFLGQDHHKELLAFKVVVDVDFVVSWSS